MTQAKHNSQIDFEDMEQRAPPKLDLSHVSALLDAEEEEVALEKFQAELSTQIADQTNFLAYLDQHPLAVSNAIYERNVRQLQDLVSEMATRHNHS